MSSMDNDKLIISATSFDPSNDIKYSKPKINRSGGKSVGINNKDSNMYLAISTPLMLTWGVNVNDFEGSGKKTYDMSLQFPNEDYHSDATRAFLNGMVELQNKIKEDAITYSKEWLNKPKMTAEVVDALFHPMLRYPKDQATGEPDYTRGPTLRVKLDYWDDEFNCEIYDMNQKPIFPTTDTSIMPIDLIEKGTHVACVIRCGGLWFANGKFGCTWKLVQAVVKPRPTLKGKCFIQLSSEEQERLNSQENSTTQDDNAVSVEVAEDSDEEEETAAEVDKSHEEPAPEPVAEPEPVAAPEPVKKKRVVKRKKKADDG